MIEVILVIVLTYALMLWLFVKILEAGGDREE